MIVDRYAPQNLFALVPQLTLAMDPELAGLDQLLEEDTLFTRVKHDLLARYPQSATRGRHGTPVEVILRMLVVRRLYDWSYEDTEHFVADSLVLRQFCRVYLERVPDDTTLIRWAGLIEPATLDALNAQVVALARQQRVTRGRKLRTDGTVVESTIHYPTDSSLLADSVRVLGRLVHRARALVDQGVTASGALFRDRSRSAKRLARQINEEARRRGDEAADRRRRAYERMLTITGCSLRQAQRVQQMLAPTGPAGRLRAQLAEVMPLVERVREQTRRRVLGGETVPASEKVVSIFEPLGHVIRRMRIRCVDRLRLLEMGCGGAGFLVHVSPRGHPNGGSCGLKGRPICALCPGDCDRIPGLSGTRSIPDGFWAVKIWRSRALHKNTLARPEGGPGAEKKERDRSGGGRSSHRGRPGSIVGAAAFHDRVRDGNGWGHSALGHQNGALTAEEMTRQRGETGGCEKKASTD